MRENRRTDISSGNIFSLTRNNINQDLHHYMYDLKRLTVDFTHGMEPWKHLNNVCMKCCAGEFSEANWCHRDYFGYRGSNRMIIRVEFARCIILCWWSLTHKRKRNMNIFYLDFGHSLILWVFQFYGYELFAKICNNLEIHFIFRYCMSYIITIHVARGVRKN